MNDIVTLELSKYPELLEVTKLARMGKACAMPSIGQAFDKVRVKSCKKTIDNDLYLITLVDDYMLYILDDIKGLAEQK